MEELQTQYLIARRAFQQGDWEQAASLCAQIVRRHGPRPDLLNLQGLALAAMNQPERAAMVLEKALATDAANSGLLLNLARIEYTLCDYRKARRHAAEAVRLAPRQGDNGAALRYQAALIARDTGDHEQSLKLLEHLVQSHPRFAEAWFLLGSLRGDLGQRTAAQSALEQAVSVQPAHARAWSELVEVRGDTLESTATLAALESIAQQASNPADQASAQLCQARLQRQAGRTAEAFRLASAAKSRIAARFNFDMDAWEAQQSALLEACQDWEPENRGSAGQRNLFIVGMPRSGTSLVERVLGAHSGVHACGELPMLHLLEQQLLRRGHDQARLQRRAGAGLEELEAAAAQYLSALPKASERSRRVVDKAPLNFTRIALLHRMFPAARIVHCERHALDVALSCWFQDFQAGLEWSADLNHIARVLVMEARAMAHWKARLPQHIHTVGYEKLVRELEPTARDLAGFIGLEFEPAMLAPHAAAGGVNTASKMQVLQPVHTSAVGAWRAFAQELEPVAAHLRQHGLLDQDNQTVS